jgi:hypothetical protein
VVNQYQDAKNKQIKRGYMRKEINDFFQEYTGAGTDKKNSNFAYRTALISKYHARAEKTKQDVKFKNIRKNN